jgi:hypothetical protein
MGKRGGMRVVDFMAVERNEFWMLTIYAKAKRDDVARPYPEAIVGGISK